MADAYHIDTSPITTHGMNPSFLISRRMCADCLDKRTTEEFLLGSPDTFIDSIYNCCRTKHDFIKGYEPLKEIIFRTILAHRNRPATADEIAVRVRNVRNHRNVRNINERVISVIMDADDYYGFIKTERE